MKIELTEYSELIGDVLALMEVAATLEAEQKKIYEALPALAEKVTARALKKHEELSKRADAITATLAEFNAGLADYRKQHREELTRLEATMRTQDEYSKKLTAELSPQVEERVRALFAEIRVPADGKPGERGEPGVNGSILDRFRGNWSDAATYKAGDIFTFRGSCYLVLRDCRGILPAKASQTGPGAYYHVLAASGAPGLPGVGADGGSGLPSMVGQSGKFLTNNGTIASWATISGGGDLLAANNLSDVASAATSFANIKQAASTTATGVVELATSAETTAGLAVQASDTRLSDSRAPSGSAGGDLTGTYPNPTFSTSVVTAAAKTVLDDATVAAMVDTLGGAAAQGTGGIVRATSPTLTTPNIGTPSAGVLTNATGLPTAGLVDAAVTLAKMANLAQDQFIGRTTASTGVPETATITAAARTVLDDTTVGAMVDTLGGATSTGTGGIARATSPALVTPTLGTPASGNLSSCTADGTNAVGFRHIPQNSQSAAYTTVLADAGKHLYHPSADTSARAWTIDSNANVAYPIGTTLTFVNDTSGGVITIAITSDTLVLAGAGTTGSRSLAANGIATAIKMTSTRWQINGTGLT